MDFDSVRQFVPLAAVSCAVGNEAPDGTRSKMARCMFPSTYCHSSSNLPDGRHIDFVLIGIGQERKLYTDC